jgi:pimeloyl-ACP methyl ester carboxylesterase
MNDETIAAPGWLEMALEARAPFEFGALLVALPWLPLLPRGDGHPVLVFPGMLGTNLSTQPLRLVLRLLGYKVHGWNQGRNLGPRPKVMAESLARIHELRLHHGRRVSLIGHSLGGIYARQLSKQAADEVRQVITLGTPFTGKPESNGASRLYETLNDREYLDVSARAELSKAPPVPTTSIYSRGDGIVAWRCSVEPPGPQTESIDVPAASHVGMAMNPFVLKIIAQRLSQPEGQWKPYTTKNHT